MPPDPADPFLVRPNRIDAAKVHLRIDPKAPVLPNGISSAIADQYRRLRAKILQQQAKTGFRSLMITSPGPAEGKTITVLNLAFSLGMIPSQQILVVDADLRSGSLGKTLGLDDRPGFSDLIEGSRLEDAVVKCDDSPLYFLSRGTPRSGAPELLQSCDLSAQIKRLTAAFSLVLIDSPPVNLTADTGLLAANSDAVLLVARAFSTKRKALEQAAQELRPYRVIGTILNAGNAVPSYSDYHRER